MDKTSLDSLPFEIQEMITVSLDQQDLVNCATVSQAWKSIFTPILWKKVHGRMEIVKGFEEYWDWTNKFLESIVGGSLINNGRFVESLRLETVAIFMGDFLNLCPSEFPRLTSVWLDGVHDGDEEQVADFLDRCTAGLKTFSFCPRVNYGRFEFGDVAAGALLRHAPTLEVFGIEGEYVCKGDFVDQLLCSAPNLKELHIQSNRMESFGGSLDAREIVTSDWVCNNMEIFSCEIGNIPRPDITKEILGQPASKYIKSGTLQESIDLQRCVYSKLARFTKLRELKLGYWFNLHVSKYEGANAEYFRQYDGLAMTVESGLDLLKDLKELEEVELFSMEVGIGNAAEKAWLAENWPQVSIVPLE